MFSQLRGRRERDGGRWYYEYLRGKARDAGKHPTMPRTAPSLLPSTKKEFSDPKVTSVAVEKI